MRNYIIACIIVLTNSILNAQSYEYKNGTLSIDGNPIATIVKTKEYIGLASSFEVFNLASEKIIVASYGADYEEDPNNNMDFYYKIEFPGTGQVGIFYVSKLNTENSFAKLIGKSGIFVDGKMDEANIKAFIDTKGKTPKKIINYTVVNRNTGWPIELKEGGIIEQDGKIIGSFKDVSNREYATDIYEFRLPSGTLVAKTNFTDGNNAQSCEIQTLKDNQTRQVKITTTETINTILASPDRNKWALERIIKWMVDNGYL